MYCPKCGKENLNDSNFCEYCGSDLKGVNRGGLERENQTQRMNYGTERRDYSHTESYNRAYSGDIADTLKQFWPVLCAVPIAVLIMLIMDLRGFNYRYPQFIVLLLTAILWGAVYASLSAIVWKGDVSAFACWCAIFVICEVIVGIVYNTYPYRYYSWNYGLSRRLLYMIRHIVVTVCPAIIAAVAVYTLKGSMKQMEESIAMGASAAVAVVISVVLSIVLSTVWSIVFRNAYTIRSSVFVNCISRAIVAFALGFVLNLLLSSNRKYH